MFDKKKLQEFTDTVIEKVECPEWADIGFGVIYVRSMTGASRDNHEIGIYQASLIEKDERIYNMRAMMVVATACDKDGNLLFTPNDAGWLGKKSAAVLDRLFEAAKKLSGTSKKDVEEMEKSLEVDPN